MTHFTHGGRWCLKLRDGYQKLYIWRTLRDMNERYGTPGKLCDEIHIEPESIAVAADFLGDHGMTPDVEALLRILVTPRKKSSKHASHKTIIKRDGSVVKRKKP